MAENDDDGTVVEELLGARLGISAQAHAAAAGGARRPRAGPVRAGRDARELAVLTVLAGGRPLSQLEAARRLGVDRTTMIARVDALEAKGLVSGDAVRRIAAATSSS